MITRFSWPGSWKSLSDVPRPDSVHEIMRARLFDRYRTDCHGGRPVLYRAVANVKASQQQAKVKEAKKAALRSSWDELLKAVCCDVDDASSTSVIVEISIPLPRNKAMEPGFGAEAQAQAWQLLSSQIPTSRQSAPPAIRMAFAAAYFHAEAMTPGLPPNVNPEDRSFEPATAIVDVICYLRHDISVLHPLR